MCTLTHAKLTYEVATVTPNSKSSRDTGKLTYTNSPGNNSCSGFCVSTVVDTKAIYLSLGATLCVYEQQKM